MDGSSGDSNVRQLEVGPVVVLHLIEECSLLLRAVVTDQLSDVAGDGVPTLLVLVQVNHG